MIIDILNHIFIHSDLITQAVLLCTYKHIGTELYKYDQHISQITLKNDPTSWIDEENIHQYGLYYAVINVKVNTGTCDIKLHIEPYEEHDNSFYGKHYISNYKNQFIIPINGVLMRKYIYNIFRIVDICNPYVRGSCRFAINRRR